MKRALACFVAVAALAAAAVGASPASAGEAPPRVDSYNEFFQSVPFEVNGSYVPVILAESCGESKDALILWYGEGTAPDYLWSVSSFDPLEYTTTAVTINGTYQPIAGDFDHDDCDDIFWYAPGTATDYVWYGDGDGTFTSRSTAVNGTYQPLVGSFDDTPGDDIFWYGPGSVTESIWLGRPSRSFAKAGAPQVRGDYRATSLFSTILFHAPGSAKDYAWTGVTPSGIRSSISFDINGTYEPLAGPESILLYGPGSSPDFGVLDIGQDVVETVPASISGTYETGVRSPSTINVFLWHAPGPAGDYLWMPSER